MTGNGKTGQRLDAQPFMRRLVELQYRRNEASFHRGTFRVRGDTIDLYPAHLEDQAWRISLFGDEVEAIHEFDPLTGERTGELASRSEEHTSELQSLMRTSYAVFCLQQKKHNN